jgi:hypothetical protein
LKCGALVVSNGEVGILYDIDENVKNNYWIARLKGDGSCMRKYAEELVQVGPFAKKSNNYLNKWKKKNEQV